MVCWVVCRDWNPRTISIECAKKTMQVMLFETRCREANPEPPILTIDALHVARSKRTTAPSLRSKLPIHVESSPLTKFREAFGAVKNQSKDRD
jgi:hypothetical protein